MAREPDIFADLGPGYEGVGEFYDLFADNSDIPFYLKHAREAGSPILDVAAGSGRVSIPLAEEGFEVVALEASDSMAEHAKSRISLLPTQIASRITLVQGDMRRFSLHRHFSMIVIPNSFGHALTTEDQLSTLSCIRAHLAPDGFFILDLFPGAIQHEHAKFKDGPVPIGDGRQVTRSGVMRLDPIRQLLRADLEYTVTRADGRQQKTITVTSGAAVIYNREADLLVRQSGLEVVKEYGSFDMEEYSHASGRRILILKKSEGE